MAVSDIVSGACRRSARVIPRLTLELDSEWESDGPGCPAFSPYEATTEQATVSHPIAVSSGVILPKDGSFADVDFLIERISALFSEKLDAITSSLNSVKEEVASARTSFDRRIAEIEKTTQYASRTVDSLKQRIESISKDVQTQRAQINNNTASHRRVQGTLQDLGDGVRFLSAEYDSRKAEVKALEARLTQQQEEIRQKLKSLVDAELSQIRDQVGSISAGSTSGARMQRTDDRVRDFHAGTELESRTQDLAREEAEICMRSRNVILYGIPEDDEDTVSKTVRKLLPECKRADIARIGRQSTSATSNTRPRPIRVSGLTQEKKASILARRKGLKIGETEVYVGHDLTRLQQKRRKIVVPTYKALLKKGIKCSLPYDQIIKDRKVLSDDEVGKLLSA